MGLRLSGVNTLISEFRPLMAKVNKDPGTIEIKPEERRRRPKRIYPDQIIKPVSIDDNGGGRFSLNLATLDCTQVVRVITKSPHKLKEITSRFNSKFISDREREKWENSDFHISEPRS